MSTPLQGRGLTLPWGGTGGRSVPLEPASQPGLPTDDELIARLRTNDAHACQSLFARYSRLAHTIAMRVLRDHAEAEDVVQETFLHVFRDAEHFDSSKGTAKNWIAQISYHQALDRRAYLERRHFQRGTEISCVEETLAGGADLDRELGSKLNRAQIDKALGDLSEMQRLTLELFYFEGFDLREISATLNEPLGNIRHHYYRGLEHLRKSIFVQKLRRSDL